jgi:ribose/xylose/arabinose/galactoside ABC-type transport system permease subunit
VAFPEAGILVALLAICAAFTAINPNFATVQNLGDVSRSASFTFVAASMATFVFAMRGLDLSVGSTIGVGAVIGGFAVVTWGWHPLLSVAVAVLAGAIVGLLNGLITVKGKIPALITTLGMLYAARGLITILTGGQPVFPFPRPFTNAVIARVAGVPVMVIGAVALLAIAHFVLNHTSFGRKVLAIGGSPEAARLVGIEVDRISIIVYTLAGAAAALTGILLAARLGTAQASAGTGSELVVIAAVIIGGTSLFGGSATILGTAIGCLLLASLSIGMTVVGLSAFYQNLVVGVVIILAVAVDQWRRSRLV